jgi:hypothetical protein
MYAMGSTNILTADNKVHWEAGTFEFEVTPPLLCPYHNRWGSSAYSQAGPFIHQPLTLPASSTSGSPVVLDANGAFVGLINVDLAQPETVTFAFDGTNRLTVNVPENAGLLVGHARDGVDHWLQYNQILRSALPLPKQPEPAFIDDIEYCTWVEQKRHFAGAVTGTGNSPQCCIDERFLDRFIERIESLQLPPGKLTIDHGWQAGDNTYGDWDVDRDKFPDMHRTVKRLRDAGFTPGLWLAPVWLHPSSRIARSQPSLLGEPIVGHNSDSPQPLNSWHYWHPGTAFRRQMDLVFRRFIDAGFAKFKLDMIYARKDLMMTLLRDLYDVVTAISPDVELEIHHPDPFLCRYAHTVRTNDVLCNADYDWRGLTLEHIDVCYRSAFGKVINLDHIGGNDPEVAEQDFLQHMDLYRPAAGHPVVSLLPDHFSETTRRELRTYLEQYNRERYSRSDYL